MAYIYVWYPDDDSWGHASMLLKDSNVYISWWPKDDKSKHKKKKKKVDAKEHLPQNYNEDVEDFTGREATHQFYISSEKIECDDVESWWHDTRGSGGYHFLERNCCDVVYAALKVGGCFQWVHPGIKMISTPRHMIRYATELENATCKNNNPFKVFRII